MDQQFYTLNISFDVLNLRHRVPTVHGNVVTIQLEDQAGKPSKRGKGAPDGGSQGDQHVTDSNSYS